MNDNQVYLQPAFILQHRKYRESSLILDVITEDYGVVTLLARGVRKKKSKTAGLLLAFTPLKLSFVGRHELKILTHVELDSTVIKLNGLSLYCGFYINELVSHFLHKNDPHPEVFYEYQQCLILLAENKKREQVLRFFEINLIGHIGYGVQLVVDAEENEPVKLLMSYCYVAEKGMVKRLKGYVCGETLYALNAREQLTEKALFESKQLMRQVIDFQLQGKELKSRAVLAKIIKQL